MYLTAQRIQVDDVTKPVHSYLYEHAADEPVDGSCAGRLARIDEAIPGCGRRIRSYLDVHFSNERTKSELWRALISFVAQAQHSPLPWFGRIDGFTIGLALDAETARVWVKEIAI